MVQAGPLPRWGARGGRRAPAAAHHFTLNNSLLPQAERCYKQAATMVAISRGMGTSPMMWAAGIAAVAAGSWLYMNRHSPHSSSPYGGPPTREYKGQSKTMEEPSPTLSAGARMEKDRTDLPSKHDVRTHGPGARRSRQALTGPCLGCAACCPHTATVLVPQRHAAPRCLAPS